MREEQKQMYREGAEQRKDNAENQKRVENLMGWYSRAQKDYQYKSLLQGLPYIAPDGTKMNAYEGIIYVIRQLGFEIVEGK
jgi:hypothetical protein